MQFLSLHSSNEKKMIIRFSLLFSIPFSGEIAWVSKHQRRERTFYISLRDYLFLNWDNNVVDEIKHVYTLVNQDNNSPKLCVRCVGKKRRVGFDGRL